MSTLPPPMPTASQAAPQSSTLLVLTVLMWIAWVGVIVVADFLGFMMFAFADSPGSARSAKLMIGPVFVWFGITFIAGIVLLIFKGWWQVPLAFVLAASPPFLVFLGYNLLAAAPTVTPANITTTFTPPPVNASVPAAGFVPPKPVATQPDFQDAIRKATSRPSE